MDVQRFELTERLEAAADRESSCLDRKLGDKRRFLHQEVIERLSARADEGGSMCDADAKGRLNRERYWDRTSELARLGTPPTV